MNDANPLGDSVFQSVADAINPANWIREKPQDEKNLKPTFEMDWNNFAKLVEDHFREWFHEDSLRFDVYHGEFEDEYDMNGEELTLIINYEASINVERNWVEEVDHKGYVSTYSCYRFDFDNIALYDEDGFKLNFVLNGWKPEGMIDQINSILNEL